MRILFVAMSLPFPPLSGHRLRTWSLLEALAEDGHAVTLLSFLEPGESLEDPLHRVCVRMETAPAPPRAGLFGRGRSLASPLPHGAWRFRSLPLQRAMSRLLDEATFDLVVVDGVYNVVNLPGDVAIPVLLNKDDVAHVILQRYARTENNTLRGLYARLEAAKTKRFEREVGRRVDAILSCSEVDAELLRDLCPGRPVYVVPNVVDTTRYAPRPGEEPGVVLFQGSMDWYPNRDAALWFAREVHPRVRRRLPQAVFRVAGRQPTPSLRRTLVEIPGVELRSDVADMRAEIASAAVCVVPLRIGSGTRLKILEAGAMGRAIVSTGLGAEGLGFLDDREILLSDDPEEFARHVVDLLEDSVRRAALGAAARRRVERDYSQGVLSARLRETLALLVPSGTSEFAESAP
jgi:glycosyltransferase involved in cell wall biosynthesis